MKEITPINVRRAAMDLLAKREHSNKELTQKLAKRFSNQQDLIGQELHKLEAEDLQSDVRLAEAFIRTRTGRGQGLVKIRAELKKKGVNEEAISLAFEECGVDWFELVRQVAAKKLGSEVAPGNFKEKARLSRFLQQRGFTYDQISSLAW